MTGYKVSAKFSSGRADCFSGYLKTKEDAEKYAAWIGETAKIIECKRSKIASYAEFNPNSMSRLRYI